jgi:transposase
VSRGIIPIIEADKGYDAEGLRLQILSMKLFPYIPYRRIGQHKSEPQIKILEKRRWKVERSIAWMQRKYRRLVVRWESFLGLGILLYWTRELVKWGLSG